MDLRQIRQFVAVAEHLHFRKAAEALYMSQPPLSTAIRRLEQSLEVELFERNRQSVRLTPAGTVLLAQSRRLLAMMEETVALTREAAKGNVGQLRLSCVPSAMLDFVPARLREFHLAYPGVRISIHESLSARLLEEVRQDKADLAILIPDPSHQLAGLNLTPLRDEYFVLACPSGHRLAASPGVHIGEIGNEPLMSFFSLAESPGFSGPLLRAFSQAGVTPNVERGYEHWSATRVLVAAGLGLAIVPRPMRALGSDSIAFVPLLNDDGSPLTYPIAAAMRVDCRNIAARDFCRLLAESSGSA